MIITIPSQGLSRDLQNDVRQWCSDNGLSTAELSLPVWVDTDSQVITVNKIVDEGEGDADFPEIHTDDDNNPITEEQIVPLLVYPPAWLDGAKSQ